MDEPAAIPALLDARAIDTRIGTPSPVAERIDRALRARFRDQGLFGVIETRRV